jgi:hypothetical protein
MMSNCDPASQEEAPLVTAWLRLLVSRITLYDFCPTLTGQSRLLTHNMQQPTCGSALHVGGLSSDIHQDRKCNTQQAAGSKTSAT